jgi:hypothetical protein
LSKRKKDWTSTRRIKQGACPSFVVDVSEIRKNKENNKSSDSYAAATLAMRESAEVRIDVVFTGMSETFL